MRGRKILLCCLTLAVAVLSQVLNRVSQQPGAGNCNYVINSQRAININNTPDIYQLIEGGEKYISRAEGRDVILLLGNTGSGKSTLGQLLTTNNDNLIAVRKGAAEYTIEDTTGKIGKSNTKSHTIFPELMEGKESFIDCPGFSDTRDASFDIAATYLIKSVVDRAKSVKILLLVGHSSVRKGVEKGDFTRLLKHATTLIRNVDRFNQSIGLVVTKVENSYEEQDDGSFKLVSDEEVKLNIASYFEAVKMELNATQSSDSIEASKIKNSIKLIHIFLSQKVNTYNKFGIFRRPTRSGPLSRNKPIQNGKKSIETLVYNSIVSVSKNADDFGYSISDTSKFKITEMVDGINEDISKNVKAVATQVQSHFRKLEEHSRNAFELYLIFSPAQRYITSAVQEAEDSTNPWLFIDKLLNIAEKFDISNVHNYLSSVPKKIKLFRFLQLVSTHQELKARQSEWIVLFKDALDYVNDSKNWYGFLNDLYEKLSEHYIQSNTAIYNVANLNDWGKKGKQHGIDITSFNLELFRTKVGETFSMRSLDDVNNLQVNDLKLSVLNNILNVTLKSGIQYSFQKMRFVASGHFVRLESVYNKMVADYSSPDIKSNIKYLEIIASDTVFIDKDLDLVGQQLNVSILAPRWYVQGVRVIKLDGFNNSNLVVGKAADGVVQGSVGNDGKAGAPGGAAGNFFGIGKQFTNGIQLTVTAVGGDGAPGESGGNGANGVDGKDPILPTSVPLEKTLILTDAFKKEYRVTLVSERSKQYSGFYNIGTEHYYQFYNISGAKGSVGGRGGNGGNGGYGGDGGIVSILALEGKSNVVTVSGRGFQGKAGMGGRGGYGGKNGCSIEVVYWSHRFHNSLDGHRLTEKSRECNMGRAVGGENGAKATNEISSDDKSNVAFFNRFASCTINKFKHLLRENLVSGGPKQIIDDTFSLLDSTIEVLNLYDAFGFINEMQNLESHFYKLTSKLDFQPFYLSLMQRINNNTVKTMARKNSREDKKVMSYLYSAALSKVCSLRNGGGGSYVVDIRSFLTTAITNIETWKDLTIQEHIAKHNEAYQSGIDNKISGANDFIENQITGEIETINLNIEKSVARLINESISKQRSAEANRKELVKNREELKRVLAMRRMFGVLKVAGSVVGVLGPWGKAVEGVVGTAGVVAEHFMSDTNATPKKQTSLPPVVEKLLNAAEKNVKKINEGRNEVLKHMLKACSDAMKKDPEVLGGNGTAEKINKIVTETEASKKDLDLGKVEKLEAELKDVIDNREKELKENSNGADKSKTKSAMSVIDGLNVMSKVTDTAFDLYKEYKVDEAKVAELNAAIDGESKAIRKLRQFESSVYKTMWPLITSVRDSFNKLQRGLDGKSQVGLDVSQWQMQSKIRDMKLDIQKFTKGFDIQEDVARCVDKLEEAMTILIKVYDRIQSYHDQKKLANLITDVTSASANAIIVGDPELRSGIRKLQIMIRANIILSQYDYAIGSFKQLVFPFADYYLADYDLPSTLEVNDSTMDLVNGAVKNLNSLSLKLAKSDAVITNYLHNNVNVHDFCGDDRFYVWEQSSYKDAISQFLSGNVVTLKADARDRETRNAVKFDVIGIKMKAVNETIQNELDEMLQGFSINMIHLGNSYYKCGQKYFSISTDSLSINYSVKHKLNEEPTTRNEVYSRLKSGDVSLSPYAMWKVQLVGSNVARLAQYKDLVDLELVGHGTFLDDDTKVCNTDLEKYYTLDENVSAFSIEPTVNY